MKNISLIIIGILCVAVTLNAQKTFKKEDIRKLNQPAEFIVRTNIVSRNPGAYTFTTSDGPVNAWLKCGNFEPFSKRTKVHATGTAANEIILPESIIHRYDSIRSGWYNGAKVRIYRIVDGRLIKVREDQIKAHFAEGWNSSNPGISSSKLIKPGVTNAETRIDPWSKHDCNYYYAVCAVAKNGTISKPSNHVEVFIPSSVKNKSPQLVNNLVDYRQPSDVTDVSAQPNSPSEFKAEIDETTGVISMSWNESGSSDLAGYRILKSDYDPATFRGNHLYLAHNTSDPDQFVRKTDMVFIDHETLTYDMDDDFTKRVRHAGQYRLRSPYFEQTENKRWKLCEHPANIPSGLKLHGGRTCIQIDIDDTDKVSLKKYNHSSLAQNWYGVLDPNETYIVEFWARQQAMSNNVATFALTGPLARNFTPLNFNLTEKWQKFHAEWSIDKLLKEDRTVGQMYLEFNGPGTVWLDNWKVFRKGIEWMDFSKADYEALRDSGMAAYRSHAHIKSSHGYSMEGFTDTAAGIEWHSNTPNSFNTLPNQLNIMTKSNLDPWLQIEMCMTEDEWLGFVEYFCAPYDPAKDTKGSKPWAYKRFAQGHPEPYLEDFDSVLFEISNETWNGMFMPFGFSGISMTDSKTGREYSGGEVYGIFQEYVIGILRSSPYWTEKAEDTFKFVLGGWAVQDSSNGYGPSAGRMSPSSDHMTVAAYNGGWDENEAPAKAGPKGFFDALTVAPRSHIPRAISFNAVRDADGANYSLGTYEAGPGYNLNGLNGVRMTDEMVEQETRTMKSLAAGTATLDVFLAQGLLGYKLQNFFTFSRNRNYWSSHARIYNGGQAYPSWKALSLYNNEGTGDFLAVQTAQVPTWDFKAKRGSRRKPVSNLPLVSVYATRNDDRMNLFVLSRKVKNYPINDDPGFTPVSLNLPIKSAKSLTLYRMTGDPSDNNLDSDKVKIERLNIESGNAGKRFTIDSTTGADKYGLPSASTFLYVFEGCKWDKRGSEPILTTAIGQSANASKPPVRFAILLSNPGLITRKDIKISGTAGAQTIASIEPVQGTYGSAYEICVDSMLKSGTVSMEYEGKTTTVDFKIPVGESLTLASWYFPGKPRERGHYALTSKELTATRCMPVIEKPVIILGDGYAMSNNEYYNDYGLATMPEWSDTKGQDATNRFIAWNIIPCNSASIALDKVTIGLWNASKTESLNYQLYYSLDGFETSHIIPFTVERDIRSCGYAQGQGIPVSADLSSIKALNKIDSPVEFRLHVWGDSPHGIGKLGRHRSIDLPDLEIKGRLIEW